MATHEHVLTHEQLGRLAFDRDGVAETTVTLAGAAIPMDVNFEGEPDAERLSGPAKLVSDIAVLDERARKAMSEDLARGEGGEALHLYKSHHAEELGEDTLTKRLGVEKLDDAAFVAGLQLARIGIYPESSDAAIVCDYTIGAELTNYLVVVSFDAEGRVASLAFES